MKKKPMILLSIISLVVILLIPIVKAVSIGDEALYLGEKEENSLKGVINKEVFEFDEIIEKRNENIAGNVYLMANDVELSNEIINGDVFIFANNVKMESDTIVNGNVFICAANIKIDSTITRGLYVVGKDIILSQNSSVKYDANLCAEHVVIYSYFDRNVNVSASELEIKDSAIISESLNYTSDKEATIDSKSKISQINFNKKVVEKESLLDIIYDYVIDFSKYFVLTFMLLIIMIKIMPNFVKKSKECLGVGSFGLGIAIIVLLPILLLAMLIFPITRTLAIFGVVMLIAILIAAMSISNIAIASAISEKHPKLKLPISVALVTLLSWAFYQIPFIGIILAFFMIATGVGVTLKYSFIKAK